MCLAILRLNMALPKMQCGLSLHFGCILIGVLDTIYRTSAFYSSYTQKSRQFTIEQLYSLDFILFYIGVVSAAILIGGSIWRNLLCLWQWIVITCIRVLLVVVSVGLAVGSTIFMPLDHKAEEREGMTNMKAFISALVPGTTYFWLHTIIPPLFMRVVYGYICELREDERRQHNESHPNVVYHPQTV